MDKITIERKILEHTVIALEYAYSADDEMVQESIKYLRAALAAQPAPAAVPPGYALVPIEPTHGMLSALTQEWHPSKHGPMKQRYRAMIAAAGKATP